MTARRSPGAPLTELIATSSAWPHCLITADTPRPSPHFPSYHPGHGNNSVNAHSPLPDFPSFSPSRKSLCPGSAQPATLSVSAHGRTWCPLVSLEINGHSSPVSMMPAGDSAVAPRYTEGLDFEHFPPPGLLFSRRKQAPSGGLSPTLPPPYERPPCGHPVPFLTSRSPPS